MTIYLFSSAILFSREKKINNKRQSFQNCRRACKKEIKDFEIDFILANTLWNVIVY